MMATRSSESSTTGGSQSKDNNNNNKNYNPQAIADSIFSEDGTHSAREAAHILAGQRFQKDVLTCFLQKFPIAGKQIVDAIRLVFSRIPFMHFDASMTDTLMSGFGRVYYERNSDLGCGPEGWYSLAMAIIMLNGDLHTKAGHTKMTLPQFRENVERLDLDKENKVPDDVVTESYNKVKDKEIVFRQVQLPSPEKKNRRKSTLTAMFPYALSKSMPAKEIEVSQRILDLNEDLGTLLVSGDLQFQLEQAPNSKPPSSARCLCVSSKPALEEFSGYLYNARLIFSKRKRRRSSGGTLGEQSSGTRSSSTSEIKDHMFNISKVLIVRHMMATKINDGQNRTFRLSHPNGHRWLLKCLDDKSADEWCHEINTIAAQTSGKPLPKSIGSQLKWQPPTFPIFKSDMNCDEKTQYFQERIEELNQELSTAGRNKAKVAYVAHELARMKLYTEHLSRRKEQEQGEGEPRLKIPLDDDSAEVVQIPPASGLDVSALSGHPHMQKGTKEVSVPSAPNNTIIDKEQPPSTDYERILSRHGSVQQFSWV